MQLTGLSAGHSAGTALVLDCCDGAAGDEYPAAFGTPFTIWSAPVNWMFCAAANRARLSARSHMECRDAFLRMLLVRSIGKYEVLPKYRFSRRTLAAVARKAAGTSLYDSRWSRETLLAGIVLGQE